MPGPNSFLGRIKSKGASQNKVVEVWIDAYPIDGDVLSH